MKTTARYQTVIELIDEILASPDVPSDRLLVDYFRQRRFIGSHDRRSVQESIYAILRQWPVLTFYQRQLDGRQAVLWHLRVCENNSVEMIEALFNGEQYGPQPLSITEARSLEMILPESTWPDWVKAATPEWLWPHCQERFGDQALVEMQTLNQPAGFDVRVNLLKNSRDSVLTTLQSEGVRVTPTPLSPWGLRFESRYALQSHDLWQNGSLEVQDEGSQLIALLTEAEPRMHVLDLCAGAGGKTLALAATMQNKGILFATDIHEWRLKRAKERLRRASVSNVECRVLGGSWLKRQAGRFDRVLIDAPCSGSGTWRRNPDLKIRFKPQDLKELQEKQQHILDMAVQAVKPGGYLIYATCSVLRSENEDQIDQFLSKHSTFSLVDIREVWQKHLTSVCPAQGPTLQLTPHRDQTDAFFVGILRKLSI
ncbi:RsmB/NOP family class I SAM-dependent RNA methyltransferase [Candidatus Finniella inopinata]|uniref:RsmB/NOP family class I SAM-dependent RNA methyltransferase n=1 Tax=Candidatus Finniella inopinata TaxID=1696036 RepID=A0A4Q7DK34_9PROT|nr:RsmB/NOP family class I SAM-dependent RNA methyltransferase [Candidatus Finniella inopinata]RZI46730.1 RsmB/NOP family class I SAM-dependent RNA methyltransferase [Candidatus Finniella inopinata]